jgi:hypothetical protein
MFGELNLPFLNALTVDSRQKPLINFDAPPPVGFQLHIKWHRRDAVQTLTLESADERIRRYDGGVTSVLTWRDGRGVQYTSGLKGNVQKKHPPLIDFETPPPVGYRLEKNQYGEPVQRPLVLVRVKPYTRKSDGGATFLLTWRSPSGALYRSGMRGPYPKAVTEDEA